MATFIDTSVVLAVINTAETHHSWSDKELRSCKGSGPTLIADIVYSEFSAGMASQADADAVVTKLGLERLRSTRSSLFLAGKAFLAYKKRGGLKTNVLSDMLIGALAADLGEPLMTSNPRDFATLFPKLKLITP